MELNYICCVLCCSFHILQRSSGAQLYLLCVYVAVSIYYRGAVALNYICCVFMLQFPYITEEQWSSTISVVCLCCSFHILQRSSGAQLYLLCVYVAVSIYYRGAVELNYIPLQQHRCLSLNSGKSNSEFLGLQQYPILQVTNFLFFYILYYYLDKISTYHISVYC